MGFRKHPGVWQRPAFFFKPSPFRAKPARAGIGADRSFRIGPPELLRADCVNPLREPSHTCRLGHVRVTSGGLPGRGSWVKRSRSWPHDAISRARPSPRSWLSPTELWPTWLLAKRARLWRWPSRLAIRHPWPSRSARPARQRSAVLRIGMAHWRWRRARSRGDAADGLARFSARQPIACIENPPTAEISGACNFRGRSCDGSSCWRAERAVRRALPPGNALALDGNDRALANQSGGFGWLDSTQPKA